VTSIELITQTKYRISTGLKQSALVQKPTQPEIEFGGNVLY